MEINERVEKLRILTKKIIAFKMIPFVTAAIIVLFIAKILAINEVIKVYLILGVFIVFIFVFLECEKRIGNIKMRCELLCEKEWCSMIDCSIYESERGFTDTEFNYFEIAKLDKKYYSNNFFKGTYKGVDIRQADVVIYREDYINDNWETTTYFDGRILEFTIDKITANNVKVFSKGYDSRLDIKDSRVDIDNLFFNDNFDVFAPEPSEAQKLLTNEMIEHLLILQNRNRSIGVRFDERLVYVAINGARPFEVASMDDVSYEEKIAVMKAEIQIAIDLIEGLGLVDEETE
ncbi:MAG: DUF3137 domain-containing protein [Lachnospiraceae bacterium]|nr:DUF3137 domain-containing protein [Lachnospiraceae bacterium]